jgi:hypothetical protein
LLWIVAPLATILAWSAGHRLTGWAVVVATLVALMGLTADAASADEGERPVRMENVEPATDGLLLAATEAGAIVWRLQGKSPCEPAVFVYDEVYADTGEPTEATAARASYPEHGCNVWWERGYVAQVRADLAYDGGLWNQRYQLASLCSVASHERGHNLGLRHAETGLMASGATDDHVPEPCRAWARRMAPRRAPRPRKARVVCVTRRDRDGDGRRARSCRRTLPRR